MDDHLVHQHDDIVVAGGVDGRVYALNAWTGTIMWTFDSGGPMVDATTCTTASESQAHVNVPVDVDGTVKALSQPFTRDVTHVSSETIPSYDGRLYHMTDNVIRELKVTIADLIQSNGPIPLIVDTKAQDILLFGEKETKLFLLNSLNGHIQPYFTHRGTQRPTDLIFGRTEFKTKVVHSQNTSISRCFKMAEYFLQFTDQSRRCSVMETTDSEVSTPRLVVQGDAHLMALDPLTQQVLWEWKMDQFTMIAVYGLRMNQASTFYQWKVPGPSSSSSSSSTTTTPKQSLLSGSESSESEEDSSIETEDPLFYEEIPRSSRVFWELMENRQGTRGIFLTYSHVAGMLIGIIMSCLLVAWGCYVKGLSAALAQTALKRIEQPHYVLVQTLTIALPGREEKKASRMKRASSYSSTFLLLMEAGEGERVERETAAEEALMEHLSRMTERSSTIASSSRLPALPVPPPPPSVSSITTDIVVWTREEEKQMFPTIEEENNQEEEEEENETEQGEEEEENSTSTSVSPPDLQISSSSSSSSPSSSSTALFPFVCQSRFANEFVQGSPLGKGGFGQVMLAENRLDGRHYAIKRVGLYLEHQTSKTLEKFLREVKILALLDHPNIVRYYQAWLEKIEEDDKQTSRKPLMDSMSSQFLPPISETTGNGWIEEEEEEEEELDDGGFEWERDEDEQVWSEEEIEEVKKSKRFVPKRTRKRGDSNASSTSSFALHRQDHWLYIQMQYCAGKNLGEYLALSTRTLAFSKILKIFTQIASAIAHVHSCGLIHRDLKPANIFVADTEGESIKLGDFGLSRYAASHVEGEGSGEGGGRGRSMQESHSYWSESGGGETLTGGVGTYLYASPEQVAGKSYDAKTDMYSLGMILFELCHPSFETSMERYITLRQARERLYPNDFHYPQVKEMLDRLLHVQPEKRPEAQQVVEWSQEWYEWSLSMARSPLRSPPSFASSSSSSTNATIDGWSLTSSLVSIHVETKKVESSLVTTLNHQLLQQVCHVITKQGEGKMEIKKCGLHVQDEKQLLEFVIDLHEQDRELLIQAIEALPDVERVHTHTGYT